MRRKGSRARGAARAGTETIPPIAGSDARAAPDGPRDAAPDPDRARRASLRRGAKRLLLGGVFVAGLLVALVGEYGWLSRLRLNAELAEARVALATQQARVDAERQAIESLRDDPFARERIARERLGLVEPGEMLFLLPPDEGGAPGGGTTPSAPD